MKIAAAEALAELARRDVPDEVDAAYSCLRLHYGREYIIPAPFDPRLIVHVSSAVAQAAMDSGVALRPIENMVAYSARLGRRLDQSAAVRQLVLDTIPETPKRVVFAVREEGKRIPAACASQDAAQGAP